MCSDISEDMFLRAVTKARQEGLTNRIVFLVCDAENLSVEDEAFDAAVCYGGSAPYGFARTAINHAARALKPGGRWLSVDPHDSPLRFIFEAAMKFKKLYDEVAADEEISAALNLKDCVRKLSLRP